MRSRFPGCCVTGVVLFVTLVVLSVIRFLCFAVGEFSGRQVEGRRVLAGLSSHRRLDGHTGILMDSGEDASHTAPSFHDDFVSECPFREKSCSSQGSLTGGTTIFSWGWRALNALQNVF